MYVINSDFSVTDYLHLPKVDINAYFSLREGGGGRGGDSIYIQVVHLIRLVQAIHPVLLIPVKRPKRF